MNSHLACSIFFAQSVDFSAAPGGQIAVTQCLSSTKSSV